MTCANCAYATDENKNGIMECRYNAPTWFPDGLGICGGEKVISGWPPTEPSGWCGKWKPRAIEDSADDGTTEGLDEIVSNDGFILEKRMSCAMTNPFPSTCVVEKWWNGVSCRCLPISFCAYFREDLRRMQERE